METQFHSNELETGLGRDGWSRFSPKNWARNQLVLSLFILAWLVFLHYRLSLHHLPGVQVLGQAFDLTRESSFPTFWTSLLTLGIGLLCFVISHFLRHEGAPKMRRYAWSFAGIVFLVFAVDDAIAFHERIGSITSLNLVSALRYPSYPWHVTVAPILGLGLLLTFFIIWRDIRKKPGLTAWLFLALACFAGAFFLDFREGVLQMESSALQQPVPGSEALPQLMLVEEVLEIAGMTFLFFVVLSYLIRLTGVVDLCRKKTAAECALKQPQSAELAASVTIPGATPAIGD